MTEQAMTLQRFLNHPVTAIILPAVIGLGGAALSVREFEQYGLSLFLGLPILVSFLASFAWTFQRQKSFRSAYGISCLSIVCLGAFILIFALDGLICLLMALPLALVLALLGTALGLSIEPPNSAAGSATISAIPCLCFSLLVGFEHVTAPEPAIREVTTSVMIDAPIGNVWDTLIAFPEITEPPRGVFRLGIAYPVEARIDGNGVGAIRYCTFSTGSFVEPITEWNAPHRLTFTVTDNPPPMRELSPFKDMHAPHLDGYMVSKQGQFRLSEQDGHVLLEGTTWYTHTIAPEFYWGLISDAIIHKIHLRVLSHIKRYSEQ